MTCTRVQEELLLYVGSDLPSALAHHVAECAECRRLWEELTTAAVTLGEDDDFAPDAHTALLMEQNILQRIKTTSGRRSQFVTGLLKIAAAVVLVVGSSFISYQVGTKHFRTPATATTDSSVQYADTQSYDTSDSTDIDESTVSLLIGDYTSNVSESGERLLDDLSTDEMEYLQKNFKTEDLL